MQLFKCFRYFLHFELLASNTIKMKVFIKIPDTIVIRNRKQKDGLERSYLVIFFFVNLKYLIFGVAAQRIHHNSEKWQLAFVRNMKMTLRLYQSISGVMTGTNASEAVQKISARTLELYANSLKQLNLQLHLWKNIFSSSLSACQRYKPGFWFFLT